MTIESPTLPVASVLADIAAGAGQVGDLKSDRVVAAFERQILSGRLAPGTRLPTESELCDILGVSRSVVRDSVRTLVARGLVTVRQGRGTTVAEPSNAAFSNAMLALLTRASLTVGEVFQARATIETGFVGLAAENGTAEDWAALEECYDKFEAAVARNDNEEAGTLHADFHWRILEAVHQPALTLLLHPLADLTIISSAATVIREFAAGWEVEAHTPILHALKAGNAEAATEAMREHYAHATRPEAYHRFMSRLFADAHFGSEPA